jgi:hypothetical protein
MGKVSQVFQVGHMGSGGSDGPSGPGESDQSTGWGWSLGSSGKWVRRVWKGPLCNK